VVQSALQILQIRRNRMRKVRILTLAISVLSLTLAAHAQTYTVLYNMTENSTGVWGPQAVGNFAQARDGNLYSTSQLGGTFTKGVIFRLTQTGQVTVLHSFDGTDGATPRGGLTLATDGFLYGTTCAGGLYNNGTVFKISASGSGYAVVHDFNINAGDGYCPEAAPVQGRDGNFYGTTTESIPGSGLVYKVTPAGVMTNLHVFNQGANKDGQTPMGIILGADGNFYGTTDTGGASDLGAVYKITPTGTFTLMHSFTGNSGDGERPRGTILQASDGNLYGTEWVGKYIYKITLAGVFTEFVTLPQQSGFSTSAGLTQATDGKFYGLGGFGFGSIMQVTTGGVVTFPHTFDYTDGGSPQVAVFQHTNGKLYGDTPEGGTSAPPGGVAYSLNMGLHPFIALVRPYGTVGQIVQILGNGLTGATSVKFGSVAATFTVVSNTYMTAVVPATATNGTISVTVPTGIRVSNKVFKVLPGIASFTPSSGAVGSQVVITGTGLAQTSKVTFGGVAATTFSKTGTKITVTVPTGAKTGKIAVTTPGGTVASATNFTVT
jgi:uncharacterized repeat protein (TIGR03803 family)